MFQENIFKESERTNSSMSLWAGGLQGGRSIISSPSLPTRMLQAVAVLGRCCLQLRLGQKAGLGAEWSDCVETCGGAKQPDLTLERNELRTDLSTVSC